MSAAPGWHGKLPSLGDFAGRRLDAAFLSPWDDWLAGGLAALLARPGGRDSYLAAPAWRFALGAGVLPSRRGRLLRRGRQAACWAGVLMPSVDRVGRLYPLTLAHPLDALPPAGSAAAAFDRWLAALARTAVAALHDDWTAEALDAALLRLGGPADGRDGADGSGDAAVPWGGAAAGVAFWQPDGDGWHGAPWRASIGLSPGLASELLGAGAIGPAAFARPAASVALPSPAAR